MLFRSDLAYKIQSYGTHEGSATVRHFFNKINTAVTLYAGGALAANNYTIESPYVEGLKIKREKNGRIDKKIFGD